MVNCDQNSSILGTGVLEKRAFAFSPSQQEINGPFIVSEQQQFWKTEMLVDLAEGNRGYRKRRVWRGTSKFLLVKEKILALISTYRI